MKSLIRILLISLLSLCATQVLAIDYSISSDDVAYITTCAYSNGDTLWCNGGQNSIVLGNTSKPAGASTQWVSFTFESQNYFTATDNHSHFAIGLRGNMGSGLEGRGLIIGDVHLRTQDGNGCANHHTIEVESFWIPVYPSTQGTEMWPTTCYANDSSALAENTQYNLMIQNSDQHWIAYWQIDGNGNYVSGTDHGVQDLVNTYISDSLSQIWITLADGAYPSWTFRLTNVQTGWY